MKNNIILIGYMGCGKSTIGCELAKKMGMKFLDTDEWIEEKVGNTISEIFALRGEAYFRDLETECLKEFLRGKKRFEDFTSKTEMYVDEVCRKEQELVISVGGGLPVREENQSLLRQLGHVIYLKAEPETVYERIKGDTARPLLQTENPRQRIKDMMAVREEKYQAAAQTIIIVDGKDVSEILEEVMEAMEKTAIW